MFLNCSFRFSEPDQKIIILDQESSNTIEKILTTDSYLILPTRIHHFKRFILQKNIKVIFKNIFRRSLKINYLSALIELINPKLIITAIDMSSDFYEISKIFRKKC